MVLGHVEMRNNGHVGFHWQGGIKDECSIHQGRAVGDPQELQASSIDILIGAQSVDQSSEHVPIWSITAFCTDVPTVHVAGGRDQSVAGQDGAELVQHGRTRSTVAVQQDADWESSGWRVPIGKLS